MHGFTMRSNVSVSGAKLAAASKLVVAQRAVAQPTRAAAIDAERWLAEAHDTDNATMIGARQ